MLQASARRFLARKQFLDMMTEKRFKSYCDLVNGRNEENDLVERNEVELGEESNDKVKEDILPDKTENDIYNEVIQTKDSEQSGINNSRTPPEAYSLDGDHDDDDDNMPDKYTTTGPEENSSLCDVPKFADTKDATDESNEYSLRKVPENGSVAEFSCTNSFVKEYGESVVDSSMKTTDECGHRPDPPVAGTQSNSRNVPLPERNAFAKVACKFDDAVTKAMTSVTSLVTCTNSDEKAFEGAIEIGKSQYKSAPSDGSVATISCPKSKRKLASTQIMYRLKQGWKIANASCPTCQLPTMIRPGDMAKICVVCNESGLENNVSMESGTSLVTFGVAAGSNALLPRPIHADNNHQLSRQMSLEISRRLSSGWLVMTYGCPSCKMPLMRSPFDNAEHCLSCGPIPTGRPDSNFALTASSNTSIMDGNNFHPRMNSYHSHNEVSFLHHDNTVDNMIIHSGFNQPSYYAENAPQHIMNPSNFESRRNLEPPSQYYHGGRNLEPISTNNHASRNHTLEPPSPYDHVDYSAPTPNHNRSGEIANAWEQDHELKENSFRDIQTFQRQQASEAALSAIEEAKLRIENARKHIRSSKAMRTPVMFSDVNGMHPNANFTHMRHGSDYFQYE